MDKLTPLDFINDLRQTINVDEVYSARCWAFAKWLKCFFPEGEVYCDCDHVVLKIEDKYYDRSGEVDPGRKIPASGGCGQCLKI